MPDWKYKAFISYSHADEKSARWLHKKLEAFRLPRNRAILQVGRKNNLGRVFRDQDELAASSDLGEKISLALGESENLIVICSPHAAQSRWVNEEVSRYQRLGRQHRIFCLVVDRAPNR